MEKAVTGYRFFLFGIACPLRVLILYAGIWHVNLTGKHQFSLAYWLQVMYNMSTGDSFRHLSVHWRRDAVSF